ncbi:conserved hypothetical protein [Sulfurihydrogenibium yellowstonense SS-5]|uniref:Uncharacterized protein n=1 Tax=Sulfurihydrogenibium yellowstonense SS-5 TaxID=432331 RepID=C4FHJ4_9AQUI|nr:conserved hypothetical protein [Sulfurihydrogenibium yellowstonense SS-5]EEP60813.1 conserved hypothetical protein [Sulfurihydrogenibium yellowstonense SS-5]EEP61063.1 conserved hypothetical protein [Sulfurihydrogenibium yellowstonense SS-5]EEP61305.1 conserved hypothetical protein [Sulfurihydrogenibium yellowstonense SS-5]EEP61473.1 conserved hypothetical protein [Sulfurihydrogenibium yellowstonense SS-5]
MVAVCAGYPTTPVWLRLPPWHHTGLGSSPFARRYLGNPIAVSFPPATKRFYFAEFGSADADDWLLTSRVSPFGNPRINACLRLPEAYRSLPRPSSLLTALGIHHGPLAAWPYLLPTAY